MILRLFSLIFLLSLTGKSDAQTTVYSDEWHNYHQLDEFSFESSKSINIGSASMHNFMLEIGRNESKADYYVYLTTNTRNSQLYFNGNISLLSGSGINIRCLDRGLVSNMIVDGSRKSSTLYFLTKNEYEELINYGISSVLFHFGSSGRQESYSFNNLSIAFETISREERMIQRMEKGIDFDYRNINVNRKIIRFPNAIDESSQITGKVVVQIFVNNDGVVTHTEVMNRETTINESTIRNLCLENSKQYHFEAITSEELAALRTAQSGKVEDEVLSNTTEMTPEEIESRRQRILQAEKTRNEIGELFASSNDENSDSASRKIERGQFKTRITYNFRLE